MTTTKKFVDHRRNLLMIETEMFVDDRDGENC